ncbi:hypothetical protein [uncultured Maricaulis sp.]|uniref:hypothetical protein n=1 Tax=uncultured Maricaulis sp. TaxID=174710 RepID=UPI0026071CDC|nr:hypothetical protein [uncultured Maricaulis sp.]
MRWSLTRYATYIKASLDMEAVMTLTELMIETTEPRLVNAVMPRHSARQDWLGWMVRRFAWLDGHADWNRKA